MDALTARYPGVSKTEAIEIAIAAHLSQDAATWLRAQAGTLPVRRGRLARRPGARAPALRRADPSAATVIVADTSVWIEYLRNGEARLGLGAGRAAGAGRARDVRPVLAELVAGVPPAHRSEYALRLRGLPWSGLDRDGWRRVGLIRGDLLREGFTASLTDVAIAVSAAQAGAVLWSGDAAHERVVAAMDDLTLRHRRG